MPMHHVLNNEMIRPFPADTECCVFGMGCFWGAERIFWSLSGVFVTAVGYAGGDTANFSDRSPTYERVCSGSTGHAEVVLVVYYPAKISYDQLLRHFWEGHDPTQGMQQGNDVGSQYRSMIQFYSSQQEQLARQSKKYYQRALGDKTITTEIMNNTLFHYAEDYHQQYLAKVPNGYCGLGGTGITYPVTAD